MNAFAERPDERLINRFLDTVGDGSGTKDAIGNYSGAEEEFFLAPETGQVMQVDRLIVQVRDVGNFDSGRYGNNVILTNGIRVEVRDNTGATLMDLVDNQPIFTNEDWGRHCYDVDHSDYGLGDAYLTVRWTFRKTGGALVLDGTKNQRLSVILEDDFTGLEAHFFKAQGHRI